MSMGTASLLGSKQSTDSIGASNAVSAAGSFRVGPTTTTARAQLEVGGTLAIDAFGFAPSIYGRRMNTSLTSPGAVTSGQGLLVVNGGGYDGTDFADFGSAITLTATENWSSSAHGGRIDFSTVANTTTSAVARLTIGQDGVTNLLPTIATPAGGSVGARLVFGTTAGFGVYYGSGAPSVSAAQGSIYLRSDGSSTSTRLYVNTNGSTTWTNVTTAA